jgi:hypothetical protein
LVDPPGTNVIFSHLYWAKIPPDIYIGPEFNPVKNTSHPRVVSPPPHLEKFWPPRLFPLSLILSFLSLSLSPPISHLSPLISMQDGAAQGQAAARHDASPTRGQAADADARRARGSVEARRVWGVGRWPSCDAALVPDEIENQFFLYMFLVLFL